MLKLVKEFLKKNYEIFKNSTKSPGEFSNKLHFLRPRSGPVSSGYAKRRQGSNRTSCSPNGDHPGSEPFASSLLLLAQHFYFPIFLITNSSSISIQSGSPVGTNGLLKSFFSYFLSSCATTF